MFQTFNTTVFFLVIMLSLSSNSFAHSVPDKSSVYIVSPKNNEQVTNPVTIKFGIKGFLIAPVGVNKHKAGHYHLLVDVKNPIDEDEPIPRDKQHLHFDAGETETTLQLPPGKHTLQLVVGDEEHEPFEKLISKKIMIDVK